MGLVRVLKKLSKRKLFTGLRSGLIPILALFSTHAVSGASYLDPSRILFERPDASTQLELIDCFKNGNCEQDDKIRIYPMPCGGSGGADCTGCYEMRGGAPVRVDDLNSAGTCAGMGSPNVQKLRVFVGYERKCPSGTTVGAACTGDGQLLLSCSMSTESTAGVNESGFIFNKDCFAGTPYVRRARAPAVTVTVVPSSVPTALKSCDAGTTGIYPNCITCSDTSYKSTFGSEACTECASPNINNSDIRNYSTAGSTKSSVNDCRVESFTCASGYFPNPVNQTCTIPPIPPPSPSPTPTETSKSPSEWTCADVNVMMTVSVTKSTAGAFNYVSSAKFTWDESNVTGSGGVEMLLAVFTQLEAPFYNKIFPKKIQGPATGYILMGPMSPANPGNYRVVGHAVVNGVVCPELGPLFFTVLP